MMSDIQNWTRQYYQPRLSCFTKSLLSCVLKFCWDDWMPQIMAYLNSQQLPHHHQRALVVQQGTGEPIYPFLLQPKSNLRAFTRSRKSPSQYLYWIEGLGPVSLWLRISSPLPLHILTPGRPPMYEKLERICTPFTQILALFLNYWRLVKRKICP